MSLYTQPANFCIPDDECELPDEYYDKARAELLADAEWVLSQIEQALEREAPDLAETLLLRDVETAAQAAAEYAADCRSDDY